MRREFNVSEVVAVICEVLLVDEPNATPNTLLKEDLGAEELDIVEISLNLEQRFGIEIDDEDGEKLVMVKDVVNVVGEKLAKKGARLGAKSRGAPKKNSEDPSVVDGEILDIDTKLD